MRLHRARVHKIEDSPGTEYEGIMCDDPVNPNPNRLRALLENKDLGMYLFIHSSQELCKHLTRDGLIVSLDYFDLGK